MTVLVTGGSGLVGSHVIEALRTRGESVRALARPGAERFVAVLGAEPFVGDATDAAAWVRAANGVTAIVHAAALVDQRESYQRFLAVNVGATRLAIRAARDARARLVHVSSVAVYGRALSRTALDSAVAEDFPFQPLAEHDFYARTKRLAEQEVQAAAERGDIDAIALRPDVIYGERDRLFTPNLLRVVRLGLIPQVGDGCNHLACVYAGNVAAAVLAALDTSGGQFGAYNVTEDAPPALSQREFVAACAAALGVRLYRVRVPIALARAGARAWGVARRRWNPSGYAGIGDAAVAFLTRDNPYTSRKARTALGWSPPWDTRAAMTRTVASFTARGRAPWPSSPT